MPITVDKVEILVTYPADVADNLVRNSIMSIKLMVIYKMDIFPIHSIPINTPF